MKFKHGQIVVVPNFVMNGERRDEVFGEVIGIQRGGNNMGKIIVRINNVYLHFEEDRLHDYEEYFEKKNKKET